MIVYRITRRKYAENIDGAGAAKYGGRWNKKGTAVLYTSESIPLAFLEFKVNIGKVDVPNLVIMTLEIPDDKIPPVNAKDLPPNWSDYPAPSHLAEITEQWVASGNGIALKVPSCIFPGLEATPNNYILNCAHPEYLKLVTIKTIEDFHFDPRLRG